METMNIRCPICKYGMVPFRIKCEDGSGRIFGWLCDCTEKNRENISQRELKTTICKGEIDYGKSNDYDMP